MTFTEAHQQGAKEFGVLWLSANEEAIKAADECGLRYYDPKIKKLLSIATLLILRKAKGKTP